MRDPVLSLPTATAYMRLPADLTPYTESDIDSSIGIEPLAIGWLHRRRPYATGKLPARFAPQLRAFCAAENTVNQAPRARPCPLCGEQVVLDDHGDPLGSAEIRVIADETVYAAPDLIYHYVTAHQYQPPQPFVAAVLDSVRNNVQAGSPAHRALIKTLQAQ